jgi:DNA-directed RNA polymerase subunit alpha
MNLTLSVSNVEQARHALVLLNTYLHIHAPDGKEVPAPAPATTPEGTPITELELDTRAYNCVRAKGIETVEELVSWSHNELLAVPNLGRGSLTQIITALARRGLMLGMKPRSIPTHP